MNEIKVKTPDVWEKHAPAVMRNIEEYRQRGFCVAYGDLQQDICGVGVAMRNQGSGLVIAVNCVVHSFQLKPGDLEENLGPRLATMARALDHSLTLV